MSQKSVPKKFQKVSTARYNQGMVKSFVCFTLDNLDIQGLQDFDNYNCNAAPHLFWSHCYFLCQTDKRTIGCDHKKQFE